MTVILGIKHELIEQKSSFFFHFASSITQKIEQNKGKDWQTTISNRTRAKKLTSKEK
jgi:hypothetical protein